MYKYTPIDELIIGAEDAVTKPLTRYGISIYVEGVPDIVDPDFHIDPTDTKGIEIFRRFAEEMAAHYKTLNS